jgi:hypothetical protein
MTENPAGWHPDPMGRHEHRYWDGTQWTDNVSDQGQMSMDPVMAAPQAVSAPAEPSRVDLPAIDPSQIRVTGAMPAITPQQQEPPATGAPATPEPAATTPEPAPVTPEPAPVTPEPAPVVPEPEPARTPDPVTADAPTQPLADTAVAPAEPEWDATPATTGTARHPVLAGLLSIAAPGSGHVYLGRRPQIGYGLIGAFVVAIIVAWFISWPIGLIIYVAAAAFAVFDLRGDWGPAARDREAALDDVDDPLAWRIVGAGGVALIVGLVLPWYRAAVEVTIGGVSNSTTANANGFDIGWPKILILIVGLAAIVLAAIHITQSSPNRSSLPEQLPLILAGAALLTWLAVIYRMLDIPGDAGGLGSLDGFGGASVDVSFGRGIGAWLDYAGALAVAAGAYAVARKPTR